MLFTVFTPTYNRSNLLKRVYSSLLTQTCKDFEWLVVDDGSSDGTESVVQSYINERKISIKYIRQDNQGKHSAQNVALSHSSGKWFVCVDSDDILSANALSNLCSQVDMTSEMDCGIIGYKTDFRNNLLCSTFPIGIQHINPYELDHTYGLTGEFAYVFKTEIVSKYLFPVVENENFITENILYDALALADYKLYLCPIVIIECEYQSEGLTNNQYKLLKNNPTGYMHYYKQRIMLAQSVKELIGYAIRYHAFRRIAAVKADKYLKKYKLLVSFCAVPGRVAVYYYKNKFKKICL